MQKRTISKELLFLLLIYLGGVLLRFIPRIGVDPHLLQFAADIWYRLCLVQHVLDFGALPQWDIRYQAYGNIPVWYNPLAVYFFVTVHKILPLELPVIISRVMPVIEAAAPIPFYFLCRELYNKRVATLATVLLSLTPTFIFWSGVSTPQGFTLFFLPVIILVWIRFTQNRFFLGSRRLHLVAMGGLLSINFLMHLTFFNTVVILLLINLALVIEKRTPFKIYVSLLVAVIISQIFTAWWWLPKNLYWYWTQVLSTSSALIVGTAFLNRYGTLSGILGHMGFVVILYLVIRKKKTVPPYYWVPVLWTVFPLIESHMEGILHALKKQNLYWNTLVRPIEGFRFYSFLAQPLAICFALTVDQVLGSAELRKRKSSVARPQDGRITFAKFCKKMPKLQNTKINPTAAISAILAVSLIGNMFINDDFIKRFSYHMVRLEDIRTAQWFRKNSSPSDRILADYYTAQMFSGICAGRALLGALFPLKKSNLPYISQGYRVLEDTYTVYTTKDPDKVNEILKRYHCTHVYLSKITLRYMEFMLNGYGDIKGLDAGKFDILVNNDFSETLLNPDYFQIIYEYQDIKILKWIKQ